MQSPNGRKVEHASALTLSTPGRSLTVDEAVLIGMTILVRSRPLRVSGVRPVASRIRLTSADPVDGGPGAPGLGQCKSDPERGEGLDLSYVGREIQERPEEVISTSGLDCPGIYGTPSTWARSKGYRFVTSYRTPPHRAHASIRN